MSMSRRAALGAGIAASAYVVAAKHAVAQNISLNFPATPLADRANRLMAAELSPMLRNHSVRGFLFGRAVAEGQGLRPGADYDEETMYLICALHDIGLADSAGGEQRFEIDGADRAARFLEDNGVTDTRVDAIWDAIAAHTSGFTDSPVWRRRRPPETWIAVDGIGVDVGGGPADLPPGFADLVHAAYPRLGGSRALGAAIEAQALADPRKAPPASLAGAIIRQRHPELPTHTWDAIVAMSGWGD
ncbi:HD domain-containing protein [Nocardia gipuzkoensis]|uniref:HD domain-containing protein n=1 Tax=Nocardia gipuzkoensis TaxID=2749991 RepID=UPI001E60A7A2|nr:HD domain-containing protein [Nocardia gipuzkoensis]UGT68641.1 HD domain-containing protein [Nocardia gipuzkoensis]